jgi:hypothetical protein
MRETLAVAAEGLEAGELPIGAIVWKRDRTRQCARGISLVVEPRWAPG